MNPNYLLNHKSYPLSQGDNGHTLKKKNLILFNIHFKNFLFTPHQEVVCYCSLASPSKNNNQDPTL